MGLVMPSVHDMVVTDAVGIAHETSWLFGLTCSPGRYVGWAPPTVLVVWTKRKSASYGCPQASRPYA